MLRLAVKMAEQLCTDWELKAFDGTAVMSAAAALHELGPMIGLSAIIIMVLIF